jgi:hypothetical protein
VYSLPWGVFSSLPLPGGFCTLRVPETSSASCGQVIFVDQASEASLSSDAVLLKIDRFGVVGYTRDGSPAI